MCSCHSILECCVTFSGVKLSITIRSFVLFSAQKGEAHNKSAPKLALLMVCTFHSSLDMHDAAHTTMISDIATSAWWTDFCHKAI